MRILVANSPRMYRESLAVSILRKRPAFEVEVAPAGNLARAVGRFAPHALVRDDDGIRTDAPEGVLGWVGIIINNHLNARISVNGRISEVHDTSLDELIAAFDEIDGLVCAGERVEASPGP